MTTAPRTPRTGLRLGAAARVVLVSAAVTALVGGSVVLLGSLLGGRPAAAGALVGVVVVVLFFALGALAVDTVATLAPAASLLVALLTYTLEVVLVGLLFVVVTGSGALEDTLDARWLAAALIAGTVAWTASQVIASVRVRQPLYDLPEAPEATGPGSGPATGRAPSDGQEASAR